MTEARRILPPEAWIHPLGDGGMQLYQPYAIGGIPGVERRRPMGTYDADGNANVPPELKNSDSLRFGFSFFDMVVETGATSADITVNLLLTGAQTAVDLGRTDRGSYEQIVQRSAMAVHGLEGSMVRRESGLLDLRKIPQHLRIQPVGWIPPELFLVFP